MYTKPLLAFISPAVARHPLLNEREFKVVLPTRMPSEIVTAVRAGGRGEVTYDDLMSTQDLLAMAEDILGNCTESVREFVVVHSEELNLFRLQAQHPEIRVRMALADADDYDAERLHSVVALARSQGQDAW